MYVSGLVILMTSAVLALDGPNTKGKGDVEEAASENLQIPVLPVSSEHPGDKNITDSNATEPQNVGWAKEVPLPEGRSLGHEMVKKKIQNIDISRGLTGITDPVRVAGWNIQRVGNTKLKKKVVDVIAKVVKRYDIIAILEVVDSKGNAPQKLLNYLNANLEEGSRDRFELKISERLGRTKYKEQYAFYYKPSRVSVVTTYQYRENTSDVFQFEPFVVVFKVASDGLEKFGIAALHAKPDDAVAEINELVKVYESVGRDIGLKDLMIIGDFNAGCSYVTGKDWEKIHTLTDKRFKWLISDHADTTTKTTSCPYDRIVVAGKALQDSVYKQTAQPFYFDEVYGIKDADLVEDISDHYPVEVLIKGYIDPDLKRNVNFSTGVTVETAVDADSIANFTDFCSRGNTAHENCSGLECNHNATCFEEHRAFAFYKDLTLIQWQSDRTESAAESLTLFSDRHSDILSNQALEVLLYKISHGALRDSSLFGEDKVTSKVNISILCQKAIRLCSITVRAAKDII